MSESAREGMAEFHLVPPPPDAEAPGIYSNFAQATVTQYDLTLYFGAYRIPALGDQPTGPVKIEVEPMSRVTIPIGLVQGMIDLLERQLGAWKGSFPGLAEATDEVDDA